MAVLECAVCSQTFDDLYQATECPHDDYDMNILVTRRTADEISYRRCHSAKEVEDFQNGLLPADSGHDIDMETA